MGLSFGSINTGLPKDIVQQIVEAEKIPLRAMESKKQKIGDKKQLVGELSKLVEDLRNHLMSNTTERGFRELKVNTNSDMLGVTFDKNVTNLGNYSLEVTQLAQKSSAMSSGFEDPDKSNIGVGYISYKLPSGETKEVYVDSEHASLNGVAKLINADTNNGMNATVVNDGTDAERPWRVVISLDDTGAGSKAEFPYLYFVDGEDDFYIEKERPAQNAKIKLDGFEVEVPGNKVKDLIPGVTLDLKKAKPGEEFSLQVEDDTETVTTKVDDLIAKINSVLAFIKTQNALDEKTDTSRTLGGDILLQTLESRIRSTIFKEVMTGDGPARLSQIGVTFKRDGLLQVDQNKLQSTLKNNTQFVTDLMSGKLLEGGLKAPGFIQNLSEVINSTLRSPDGLIHTRKKGLQDGIDQIDRRIEQRMRIIDQKERALKDKFARLEGTMAKLKGQGAGLAGLSANTDGIVQQLG